nr:putative ribonuclease H-like domain-containing protein [Tanacetum cinerariifolium]
YPRDSLFNLEAFLDNDYARASLGRKSTTGDCQFLGKKMISWQCKKQTVVANSTTKAEYPRDLLFNLEAFLDNDYARASLGRKSTTGDCQFLRKRMISWQCKKQTVVANSTTKAEYVAAANCYGQARAKVKNVNREAQIQALIDKKKVIITKTSIRRDLRFKVEGGVDCLSNEVIFKQLTLMGYEKLSQKLTFYKAFFSLQWKFLKHTILQWLSAKTNTWNEFSSIMASVLNFVKAKTAQAKEIASLKKRVKKLEQKRKLRTLGLKRLRKVGTGSKIESSTEASLDHQEDASKHRRMIDSIDPDVEITLVDGTQRG